jgi:hypothetical protein
MKTKIKKRETTVQIGKRFEKKAFKELKERFDKVEWLSKLNWGSEHDFKVKLGNKNITIDAKSSLNAVKCGRTSSDLIITQFENGILFLDPSLCEKKNPSETTIRIELPNNLDKRLKVEMAELEYTRKSDLITDILLNYYGLKVKKRKNK